MHLVIRSSVTGNLLTRIAIGAITMEKNAPGTGSHGHEAERGKTDLDQQLRAIAIQSQIPDQIPQTPPEIRMRIHKP